jgi:hypothetical protein
MTGEWNECLMRASGAWWPYKTERVGLGRFGPVGSIGRLWLVQEDGGEGSWWVASFRRIREREWRGLLQGFLNYAQDLHGSPFYSFQALKDKGERGMLQYISSRGWWWRWSD